MLFAALPGTKIDGMAFAEDAISRGAVAILGGSDAAISGAVPVLASANPRRALALMAARYYVFQPKTIAAVTGTNGKTSVAAFLRQIWHALGHPAASLGTVGIVTAAGETPLSHTTPDPISLHRDLARLAEEGVTHLALEASSHGLAQHRLDGVKLSAGAFTNITRDHLDYHETFQDYFDAKLRLFTELLEPGQPAVIEADGDGAREAIEVAKSCKLDVITVGQAGERIALRESVRKGFAQRLTLFVDGSEYIVDLPLAGGFQVSNALVAAGLAIATGASPGAATSALANLRGAKGRLEYAGETVTGAPIFIDYAHTPDALAKALEALRPYVESKLLVVFGCGGDRDRGKRPEMGRAAARYADAVYITDDNPRSEDPAVIRRAILDAAPGAVEIASRAEAVATSIDAACKGDVVLIAGKGHETGQIAGNTVLPYSDHDAVAAALHGRAASRRLGHG